VSAADIPESKIELQAALTDVESQIFNLMALMPRLSHGQFDAALDRLCELRAHRKNLGFKLAALEQ
jgi:hypothetical protein